MPQASPVTQTSLVACARTQPGALRHDAAAVGARHAHQRGATRGPAPLKVAQRPLYGCRWHSCPRHRSCLRRIPERGCHLAAVLHAHCTHCRAWGIEAGCNAFPSHINSCCWNVLDHLQTAATTAHKAFAGKRWCKTRSNILKFCGRSQCEGCRSARWSARAHTMQFECFMMGRDTARGHPPLEPCSRPGPERALWGAQHHQ